MGLEPHALEKPACPYCGSNANVRFDLDLEDNQCALKPTNGREECILINGNGSHSPYLTKIARDKPCPLNTEENRIKLAKRLIEREEREIERQMKKYNIKVKYCPPGNALGSVETIFDRLV